MSRGSRLDKLARRVGWLDRFRRLIAVACGLVIAPLLIVSLAQQLGSDWPRFHAIALCVCAGFVVWVVAEVGLAWLAAVWETEHSQLSRTRGLPQAYVVTRK